MPQTNDKLVMRKKSVIFLIVLALALAGFGFYKFYLYKPARDVGSEGASYAVDAGRFVKEYAKDPATADTKYLNEVIEIKGKITAAADSLVTVDSLVVCGFDGLPAKKEVGDAVMIKGRCIGYDELFGEVKLDQCTIKE